MAVVIRLRRVGTTNKHHHRVVVTDKRSPRDGRFIEAIGYYDPNQDPAVVKVSRDRALFWLRRGARPSLTVASLFEKLGIDHTKG
ncbi:MAG: 30S ribosomal protein S16 [Candidatus Omnitrophica bacterium]|nr:30S ribosomal protein S16 [Candidatus Omnitrophota bacterium]